MSVPQLEQRLRGWLESEYVAILFEDRGKVVAYALYREQPDEIYLRQLYVVRHRRRQGLGKQAMHLLRSEIWPKTKRLTVEVLVANTAAVAFWRAVGYRDYSLTLEIRAEVEIRHEHCEFCRGLSRRITCGPIRRRNVLGMLALSMEPPQRRHRTRR